MNERLKFLTDKEKEAIGDNPKIYFKSTLVKDFTKYQLGAHTDNFNKIISILFYLPEDDELKSIGTALYMPNDIIEDGLARHFTREETNKLFTKFKTCEFKRNSVLMFPRTNYSYHGVEEVNINQKERNTYLINFYGKKEN